MNKAKISEIQIVPIKPNKGLVAFVSFILNNCLYLSSIGIVTRPNGGYRLVYPTKKTQDKDFQVFHPISKDFGELLEKEVIIAYEKVIKTHDRYCCTNNTHN